MKNLILTLFAFFFLAPSAELEACSCPYVHDFCGAARETDNITLVRFIDTIDTYNFLVEVIDNVYGQMSADTVVLLGQDGQNCAEDFESIFASDTAVVRTNETWQENLYATTFCARCYLHYSNGTVTGPVFGIDTVMVYSDFVEGIEDCILHEVGLSTNETFFEEVQVYPTPFQDELIIHTDNRGLEEVSFYGINGQLIQKYEAIPMGTTSLPTQKLKPGLYILKVYSDDKVFAKLVIRS